MSVKIQRLLMLALSLTLLLCIPLPVLAAEAGNDVTTGVESTGEGRVVYDAPPDAIDEILLDGRFNGAVEQIQWLTKWFDQFSVQIISVCAFLIIAAAFLKNAMAGTYCANSKFWDKVADAHAKKDALSMSTIKGYFTGGQYQNTTVAGFKDGILALIPNVKSFTEFEDADIQPKQYFMRSIPQMCMCVIIGIFIYNGYYRDTAAVIGEFGSEAFTRIMTAASPSEFLDKITQTTGMPALITDGATDPQGKLLNKIADAGRKACITEFGISSNAGKIKISQEVENWVLDKVQYAVEPYMQDLPDDSWKVTAKVKLVPSADGKVDESLNVTDHTLPTNTIVIMSDSSILNSGWILDNTASTMGDGKETLYLRVIITAVKKESSSGAGAGKTVNERNDVIQTTSAFSATPLSISLSGTISNGSITATIPTNGSINGETYYFYFESTASGEHKINGTEVRFNPGNRTVSLPIDSSGVSATYQFQNKSPYAVGPDGTKYIINLTITGS